MEKFLLAVALLLGGLASVGIAQSPTPAPTPSAQAQREQERRNAEFVRRARTVPDFGHKDEALPPARPENPAPTAISPSREQRLQLSPSTDDLTKYADLLHRTNARLIKLFPDTGCVASLLVVRADDPCLDFIPYSSFYSFRKGNYTPKMLSDIGLKDGAFFTDGVFANGVIVALGDVAFESVTLDTDGMRGLSELQPATKLSEVEGNNRQMTAGITIADRKYGRTSPVVENVTYAIRVIAYRRFLDDKRGDIIAVFRVVRKDPDGNVTLMWRELQRKDSPKIKGVSPRK